MPAQLLGQNASEETSSVTEVLTAFLVIITKDGNFILEPNINKPVVPDRAPTTVEIEAALHTIISEVTSQKTAAHIIYQMDLKARQAYEAQQNQALLAQLGKK